MSTPTLAVLLLLGAGAAGVAPSLPPGARGPELPQAPSGLFRPWMARATGSWPEAVALGDLDHDGRRDVALVTSYFDDPANDYTVHVFLQTAGGGLAPAVKYALPPGGRNRSMDIGDVTGDGRDDVVVGTGDAIVVLMQNASGTLDAPLPYTTDNSFQIKIGDFNTDGRKDVAGMDMDTPDVAVYLQNAGGTLDPPALYSVEHHDRSELEAGDVNTDGRDDIVVMSGQAPGDPLGILVQTAAGGFAPPAYYDLQPGNKSVGGIEVADLNGDQRNDVVMTYGGNQPSSYIGVYAQNAQGTLNAPFSLASYDIPEPVEAADLDANGYRDLAVLHGGWGALGVYRQSASGVLGAETLEPIPNASTYQKQGLALGDVNGDSRPDAVIADYGSGLVVLYQKSAFDLGVAMSGPSSNVTGNYGTYQITVRNNGSSPVAGAVLRDTPSAGLEYVSTSSPATCSFAAGTLTCSLPPLAPGEEVLVSVLVIAIAGGTQVNQATVTGPQPDGHPEDNSASVSTLVTASCQEVVADGSFEFGTTTPFWTQASTNFGTPLCTTASCGTGGGTALPHTGAWWAWFGGIDVFEQAMLQQTVMLPPGTARLRFHFWVGARSGNGADRLFVSIDGVGVFGWNESMPGFDVYTLREVDISHFATGGNRQIRIEATTFGAGITGVTNFSIDDVSLEWCPLPTLSISDAPNVTEGNGGGASAVFSVSLSQPVAAPVAVNWATGNATGGVPATAGADYTPGAGSLTFPSGSVSLPLAVPVLGDLLDEFDERFAVTLSAASGATITDAAGDATILDDDPLPSVSISDATLVEGASGATTGQLTVSLTPVSGRAVSGTFATADVTAVAGTDYTATTGAFSVPAGALSTVAAVPVLGDALDEQDETFTVTLSAPDFAVLGDAQAVATIDDDDGPSLTIADATVTEGDAGTSPASFALSLSAPSVQTVTLDYATASGTATAGSDFTATSGSVTFAPGQTSANVSVPVMGDVLDEPNEFFGVVLSNAVDALPADAQALGVIVDDDGGTFPLAGELSHGVEQWRSLSGAGPRDLFVLARPAFSSFEVQVDAASGDLGVGDGPILRRLAPDLSTVVQTSSPAGTGPARVLTVVNEQASPEADYIEVASAGCSTDCGPDDRYRIVVRETTLTAPRFNNSGGQVTVFLLQNRGDRTVEGTLRFWSSGAALLAELAVRIGPLQTLALNSAGIAALAGRSGSVTATHDGPYGALVGKAVALEPASGFAFDTPFDVRRR